MLRAWEITSWRYLKAIEHVSDESPREIANDMAV